jgi:4,5-dihydroxyphthalate decarboxylase
MLLAGDLDALMCPEPPSGFYDPHSPVVRLIPDYRQAEREYFRRTGVYPPQHVIVMKRDAFDRDPGVATRLYAALEESKATWQRGRRELASMPWALTELEEIRGVLGEDWHPNGVEPNRRAIQTFLDEQLAQGLIPEPLPIDALFADFERAAGR